MTSAFSHITVCVPDIEAARRFYVASFDFLAAEEGFESSGPAMNRLTGIEGCHLQGLFMRKDGLLVELTSYRTAQGAESGRHDSPLPRREDEHGFAHFAFRVADIDETAALVAANGGVVLHDTRLEMATRVSEQPIVLIFCTDPFGNRIELIQHPDEESARTHGRWMKASDLDWPTAPLRARDAGSAAR